MCRNIKPLYNFDPPATEDEIRSASLQFVRKISGFQKPSRVNEQVFNAAVDAIASDVRIMFSQLTTQAATRNREQEASKRAARFKHQ